MKHFFTIMLLLAVYTTTALAQSNQVVFSFDHKAGTEPLKLNQTVFNIWNNKAVILTRAEFYVSEVALLHPDGTQMPLSDKYLLLNANDSSTEYDLGIWPLASAHGLTLHLGVPQSVNHNDPTTWPANHPLAPQNPTMHWGWTAGYRFMAIEGKVDNNGDGTPETTFEFHNLGDALYKTLELTGTKDAENGVLHLHFILDYAQLFKNMTMTGNLIQHGSASMNISMMNNAATPQFVAMVSATDVNNVETNSHNLNAIPNPANAEVVLEYDLSSKGAITLQLTNTLGQVVHQKTGLTPAGVIRLETAGMPVGIYQYAFYENGILLARKKLVINH